MSNKRQKRTAIGRNFWMFVESAKNFDVLRDLNFSLFGMGPKYRRRAERMKPDDRVLFYVSGLRKWPATATIASTYFEDDSPLWVPTTRHESFRYRIKLKPTIVLDENDYIDALVLGPRLDYVKRWAPQDWPLAFWDRLHLLPQRDFRLIESEMQRVAARHRRSVRREIQQMDRPESYGLEIDGQESHGNDDYDPGIDVQEIDGPEPTPQNDADEDLTAEPEDFGDDFSAPAESGAQANEPAAEE